MFNREIPHKTSADVLAANSQIASYFNAVDNAVSIGDTNKRYQPVNNTSYGPPAPIHPNTFTTVIISPTADNTADIYNGFISANMKIKVSLNKEISKWSETNTYTVTPEDGGEPLTLDLPKSIKNPHRVWVGFKDALDAIEKYEIMANGISVYTQNNAIEESYITACGMPEAARRSNCFSHARHKDVFAGKMGNSCGVYVDFAGVGKDKATAEMDIPLKIDLRRFLPLSNIKYLPAFAGKIELRILFGVQGLVVAPVSPVACFNTPHSVAQYGIDEVTNEFVPATQEFTMITKYTAPTYSDSSKEPLTVQPVKTFGKLEAEDVKLSVVTYHMSKCESVINCFGIASDVYDALVMRYVETPLTFPTQTLSFAPLANVLKNGSGASSITLTPRFVDSLFVLFPLKQNCRTCYKNPQLTGYQIQCGGYGSLPSIMHGTNDNDAALTMEELQNALNVNCDTVGLNKDVARSMINGGIDFSTGYNSQDCTNFLIGFATETDNTFQQGQTSNTPITYTFSYNQDSKSHYATNVEVPPIVGVLVDSTFSIQIRPDGAPPIVEIGAYDITSPVTIQ